MEAPLWVHLLVIFVILLVGRTILIFCKQNDSDNFANKFAHLGNLIGRPESEIVKAMGTPTRIDRLENRYIYTWIKPAYEIGLFFADGVCQGIAHESRVDLIDSP